jgi:hypothetical protein
MKDHVFDEVNYRACIDATRRQRHAGAESPPPRPTRAHVLSYAGR